MAATDREAGSHTPLPVRNSVHRETGSPLPRSPAGALLAAALALPGMVPGGAGAQAAPDRGLVELKYLDYRDWQPGANRMTVRSPSLYAVMPLSDTLVVEGSVVYDSMSGASPLYYNTLSGASGLGVTDYRTAGEVKVTRYFNGMAIAAGAAVSSERDYLSRAGSLEWRIFSDDRNRTWAFAVGGANDRINPVNGLVVNAPRNTLDFLVGVTQALSATAIVQSNLTYSRGHGYYSDPYKLARHAARSPRGVRVAHPVQPVSSRAGRDAPALVSLPARLVRQSVQRARSDVVPTAVRRMERRARTSLLHAECRRFLLRPAVSRGPRFRAELHGRHAALGIRRVHAGRHRREEPSPTAGAPS